MNAITIIDNYTGHDEQEPVVLGHILNPNIPDEVTEKHVKDLWDGFMESRPDTDSDFMMFLKLHNYKPVFNNLEIVGQIVIG